MKKLWNVAIYARVSTDKKEQQESIPAQVQSLKNWILERSVQDTNGEYNLINVYEDMGTSGSTFERGSFLKMKREIEQGKINMVLTRDLSRFGRNYIIAGYYLESYFREHGVRFVSVLDNVDTEAEVDEIVPFKNILNEMYVRDCSKRTKDGLKQKMLRGSSIASKPPYGYKFKEGWKDGLRTIELIPAEDDTTEIVKKIFSLYLTGWGFSRIAESLNDKEILPPSARLYFPRAKRNLWTTNSVKMILTNPKYGGMLVQSRYRKISYKTKKIKQVPQEEWIYSGEFKGIIDRDTYFRVQEILKGRQKKSRNKKGLTHLFSTVLKCNECGGSMSYRKEYKGYKCTNSQSGKHICTAHSIKEDSLKEFIVRDLIQAVEKMDEVELYKVIDHTFIEQKEIDKELIQIHIELNKINKKLEKLYQDYSTESIREYNFEYLLQQMQKEQEKWMQRRKLVEMKRQKGKEGEEYKSRILEEIGEGQLDREAIETFIDKIIVAEDKNLHKKRVEVFYKFKKG